MIFHKLARTVFGVSTTEIENAIAGEMTVGATFERLIFPLKSLRHIHLIQFLNRNSERTIAGLGSDISEQAAYTKAVFEYFERKAVLKCGEPLGFNSTNGVAAHRYKLLAERAALNELFERDSFLRHWYTAMPFRKLPCPKTGLSASALKELNTLGYDLLLRETFLGVKTTQIAFIINRSTGGFAIGLSSGRGGIKDIEKAIVEAAMNLYFGHEGYSEEQLINDVNKYGFQLLRDHRAYWLLVSTIPEWILGTNEQTSIPKSRRPSFSIQTVLITAEPVPVVGVRSGDLLSLTLGPTSESNLTILRKSGLYSERFSLIPHPIP